MLTLKATPELQKSVAHHTTAIHVNNAAKTGSGALTERIPHSNANRTIQTSSVRTVNGRGPISFSFEIAGSSSAEGDPEG